MESNTRDQFVADQVITAISSTGYFQQEKADIFQFSLEPDNTVKVEAYPSSYEKAASLFVRRFAEEVFKAVHGHEWRLMRCSTVEFKHNDILSRIVTIPANDGEWQIEVSLIPRDYYFTAKRGAWRHVSVDHNNQRVMSMVIHS